MAILEETYNYEQNIAKIFSDHNVRETNFDILNFKLDRKAFLSWKIKNN